jgi:hypothetical protein
MEGPTLRFSSLKPLVQAFTVELPLSGAGLRAALTDLHPTELPVEIVIGTKDTVVEVIALDFEEGHAQPLVMRTWGWKPTDPARPWSGEQGYVVVVDKQGRRVRRRR